MDRRINEQLFRAVIEGQLEDVKAMIEGKGGMDCNAVCEGHQLKNSLVHSAVSLCRVDIVKYLIEKKVDLNKKNIIGGTPLQEAVQLGNFELMKLLVDNGADCNALNNNQISPCCVAVQNGCHEFIKYVVQMRKVDVNKGAQFGGGLLHAVAMMGNLELFKLIVENGGDCKLIDEKGQTPFHVAATSGHSDLIRYLVKEKGVNVNQPDKNGNSSLQLAVERCNVETVQMIIEHGGDCSTVDLVGNTLLHTVAFKCNPKVVKYLISTGMFIVNKRNKQILTPLHIACGQSNVETVRALIDAGADLDALDEDGYLPFHHAIIFRKSDTIKFFVSENIVDVKKPRKFRKKEQGLMNVVATTGDLALVKFFIDKGADCTVSDGDGDFPIHNAICAGHTKVVQYFIEEKNVDVNFACGKAANLLHCACQTPYLDIVKMLIEMGADRKVIDEFGNTCLHRAAMGGNPRGNLSVVKYLIDEMKFDVNAGNYVNATPILLCVASRDCRLEVIKLLIDRGADLNAINQYGVGVLGFAISRLHTDVVKYLVDEKNVDINRPNHITGTLALHFAAETGDLDVFKFLVDKGGDYKARDGNGFSCLTIAKINGNRSIVKYLVDKENAN